MPTELTNRIAAELRAALARHKGTQEGLARDLGHSTSWVSRRLNGRLPITYEELFTITDGIGVECAVAIQIGEVTITYPATDAPDDPAP